MTSRSDLDHYEWRAKGRKLDCVDSLSEFAPIPIAPEVEQPKTSTLNLASQLLHRAASTIVGDGAPQKDSAQDSIAEAKHTILQRITSILDRGGKVSAANLNDSEFKQFWMPDRNCKECYECGMKFSMLKRRHHCRICGRIFCSTCCNLDMIKKHKDDIDLRVCQYCAADILNYLKSKTSTNRAAEATVMNVNMNRRESVSFREEAFWQENGGSFVAVENSIEVSAGGSDEALDIEALWKRTLDVFPFQNHRQADLSYPNTATGASLVTWFQAEMNSDRADAIAVGQQLIDAGLLETVGQPSVKQFVDATILYRPVGLSADPTAEKEGDNADPLWVSEIAQESRSSSEEQLGPLDWPKPVSRTGTMDKKVIKSDSAFKLDLNLQRNFAAVSRTQLGLENESGNSTEGAFAGNAWDLADGGRETANDEGAVSGALLASTEQTGGQLDEKAIPEHEMDEIRACFDSQYSHMEKEMLNQQLASNGLNQSWAEVIISIVHRIASTVTPPPINNDIRNFVHVKKIPGGSKKDTTIVWGTAFSKHLVHKAMRFQVEKPKLLILQGAITYQRNEQKIDTLEPIVMQEQDYVKYAIAKIRAYQPDILIVEKSVSWLVREKVRELNVSLITNVKKSVMDRLAHLTGSSQVIGLDALGSPTLGSCERFAVRCFEMSNSQKKFITVFSGCPEQLGCAVLLRGGSPTELSKIKRVLKFMIFMNYNWRLEKAFLLNEFAVPPIKGGTLVGVDEEETAAHQIEDGKTDQDTTSPPHLQVQTSVVEIREIEPEAVEDNSDPLRSVDSDNFLVNSPVADRQRPAADEEEGKYYTHVQFRNVLKNTLLTISPFVKVNPPYMETPAGANCLLRQYLPKELYASEKLQTPHASVAPLLKLEPASMNVMDAELWTKRPDIELLDPHPFLALASTPLGKGRLRDNPKFRALLADFRGRGSRFNKICRCRLDDKSPPPGSHRQLATIQKQRQLQNALLKQDCFSPYNHQQMVVLFFSYSSRSKNAPGFCVDPNFLTMDFYGNQDITLGRYLERYCLQPEYACQCGLEMLHHIRKFIHDSGSIVLNTCYLEKLFLPQNKISMWSFCRNCRFMSKVETMSKETWNLSFAKYLELRFHGAAYTSRGSVSEPCGHSLHHDNFQYFSTGHMVAVMKYVEITIREIVLPPTTIRIKDQSLNVSKISDEIRELSEKSSDFYQTVLKALMNVKEQVAGTKHDAWVTQMLEIHREHKAKSKDHIEKLNVQLTTPAGEAKEDMYWPISDSLVRLKTHIADGVLTWNNLLNNFENVRKKDEKASKGDNSNSFVKPSVDLAAVGPLDNDSVDQSEVICDPTKLLECQENRKNASPSVTTMSDASDVEIEGRTPSLTDEKFVRSEELTMSVDAKQERRGTVKTIFSQFLNTGSSTVIQSPFQPSEHYNLNLATDPPVAVYDMEPSSIIAAALASTNYQAGLAQIQSQLSAITEHLNEVAPHEVVDVLEMKNFTLPTAGSSTSKAEQVQLHVDIQFQDISSRYYCRIYFAEQFRQVRKLLFPAGEQRFIYSLSRCVPWKAQGGKSGSVFCKTLDDRFILKEMSSSEMDCVRQEFGLKYFNYISRASKGHHPTVLGKIVGIYRIGCHNSATNYQCKMDLLVMENLFYERNIDQKFDLKGSERNRLVDDVERDDVVLLDENFMMKMCDRPLYIRQHSKKVLMDAITNDSSFLAECKVMDYSLLVGIDTERNEFVVGIIDYVRQFTWDKKAEMFVKSITTLYVKSPTVIWPAEYKSRFQGAMNRYFLAVPDRWTPMGKETYRLRTDRRPSACCWSAK